MNVIFFSLGCDKNKVDSEKILFYLFKSCKNVNIVNDFDNADICIINTCSFIHDAKIESFNYIKEAIKYKNNKYYPLKKIIIFGCLASEYKNSLKNKFPEIDEVYTFKQYEKDIDLINERVLDYPSYISSLKIAEGCNRHCSYCIIPKLKGAYHSFPIEKLFEETVFLEKCGVKELNIIAQDTTNYGIDIYKQNMLDVLLKELTRVKNIHWFRLLYCYPEFINDKLINEIKNNNKIVKYLDIPIQHISNNILRKMNRKTTKDDIIKTIDKLRKNIPDISLRTSIIVGFPGETEDDFIELCDFIKEIQFDKLGVFTYSDEINAPSYKLKNKINENIKIKRKNILMNIQKNIIVKKNEQSLNNIYECIVDGYYSDSNLYCGRTSYNAKDIDYVVYFKSKKKLISGSFVNIRITKTINYDLYGEIV